MKEKEVACHEVPGIPDVGVRGFDDAAQAFHASMLEANGFTDEGHRAVGFSLAGPTSHMPAHTAHHDSLKDAAVF